MRDNLEERVRLTTVEWLNERLENTIRIASEKTGADRAGWLEDAAYFRQALSMIAGRQRQIEGLQEDIRVASSHYRKARDGYVEKIAEQQREIETLRREIADYWRNKV